MDIENLQSELEEKKIVKHPNSKSVDGYKVRRQIRKLSMSALFVALSFVLSFLTYGLPKMPQGGSISLEGLGIVISGLYLGPVYGFVVGACYSLINLMMDGVVYHWASVFLDYIIPFAGIGLMGGLFSKLYYKNKPWSFFVAAILGFVIKYLSSSISGAFLFGEYAPDNMQPFYYSFVYYNLPYNAISLAAVLVIGGALYIPLQKMTKQVQLIIG